MPTLTLASHTRKRSITRHTPQHNGGPLITEKDAAEAVPKSGFVNAYMKFALKQTTAPLGYHLAMGLSLLGVTTPMTYGTSYAGDLYGNLFTLLVGKSGDAQKSSALGVAKKVLYAAQEHLPLPLLGKQPGSPEGLVDALVAQPRQVIYYSEFGAFLAKAQRKGTYFEPIKAYYTDLWDCQPVDRLKANNVSISQPNPRLSLAAGVSLSYLEDNTTAADWAGGFMGRWAIIYAERERTVSYPKNDWSPIPGLAAQLVERAKLEEAGACLGLSPQAYKKWDNWFHYNDKRHVPDMIAGVKTRVPTLAMKAALLYAWDFGEPMQGEPWYLEEHHVEYGIRFAELHLKSILGLTAYFAEHGDAQIRRTVLEAIPVGGVKTLGEILLRTKLKKRTVIEVLDGLTVEGTVKMHVITGSVAGALYERVDALTG